MTPASVMCAVSGLQTMLTSPFQKTKRHTLTDPCFSAGVGYATAARLVDAFGTNVLGLMDSDECVEALSRVETIGHTRAANIKQLWDASRGMSHAPSVHLAVSLLSF